MVSDCCNIDVCSNVLAKNNDILSQELSGCLHFHIIPCCSNDVNSFEVELAENNSGTSPNGVLQDGKGVHMSGSIGYRGTKPLALVPNLKVSLHTMTIMCMCIKALSTIAWGLFYFFLCVCVKIYCANVYVILPGPFVSCQLNSCMFPFVEHLDFQLH